MDLLDTQLFGMIGDEGFSRLVAAFYRLVPDDDILGPMYPKQDLAGAEWRLREFLVGRFGGPMRYVERRGHPRLGMRHGRFKVDAAARDRWLQLMERAMADASLPPEAERMLRQFFQSTATFLINTGGEAASGTT